MTLKRLVFFAAILAMSGPTYSADNGKRVATRIAYGINKIDLTGDGVPGMAVFARRENFNAHGFDVLTMYLNTSARYNNSPAWQIVPVLDGSTEKLEISVSGGADCLIHDFRLSSSSQGRAQLVTADRDIGDNYGSSSAVTFQFYELRNNDEGIPGWPLYYFEHVRSSRSHHRYCDVGEAFQEELQIGPYMDRFQ